MIIENLVDKVLCLKAFNKLDLRLLPGFNKVEGSTDDLAPYFSSKAADALMNGYKKNDIVYEKNKNSDDSDRIENMIIFQKNITIRPSLRFYSEDELSEEDLEAAEEAKRKNDKLNSLGQGIKRQYTHLGKDSAANNQSQEVQVKTDIINKQQQELDDLRSQLLELKNQINNPKSKSKSK